MFVFENFISGWRILISVHHCAIKDPYFRVDFFLELKGRCFATVYTSQSSVSKFPRVSVRFFSSGQKGVWYVLVFLVPIRILESKAVPFIFVISDSIG